MEKWYVCLGGSVNLSPTPASSLSLKVVYFFNFMLIMDDSWVKRAGKVTNDGYGSGLDKPSAFNNFLYCCSKLFFLGSN